MIKACLVSSSEMKKKRKESEILIKTERCEPNMKKSDNPFAYLMSFKRWREVLWPLIVEGMKKHDPR